MATISNVALEEVANVAVESVSSLDNLHFEVQHILGEIRHLEKRCQVLQSDIAKDQGRYIKYSLRQNGATTSSSDSSLAANTSNNAKAHLPARISEAYTEIFALSDHKVELAQRLVELLTRAQSRLDVDVSKVRSLQGEPVEDIRAPGFLPSAAQYANRKLEPSVFAALPSPAAQISETLRGALNATLPSAESTSKLATTSPVSTPSQNTNKKRRLNTQPTIKLRAPTPADTSASSRSRGRPGRPTKSRTEEPDEDMDAEGDEEVEDGEEEDLTLYCFCQKQSYGDMIGCDNPDCPYQWFHINCVGVKTPLPDKWYCPECVKQRNNITERRKGRKK